MSLLSYSSDLRIESVLACTHCARAKSKCDRKVPCTRCVDRKLACETRPPRRGHGHTRSSNPSSNGSRAKRPRSKGFDVLSGTAALMLASGDRFSTQDLLQTAEDSYTEMDWTLPNESSSDLQVPALPGPPVTVSLSNGVYVPHPCEGAGRYALEDLLPGDQFHFDPFSRVPSPTAYLNSWTDTDSSLCDIPCQMSGTAPFRESQDNMMPLEEAEAVSDVQPQTEALDGWPIFKCNPIVPSSECIPTAARHVNHLRILLERCTSPIESSGLVDSTSALTPLLATTRERLTAVLQGLFNEAQHVYNLRELAIGTNTASQHPHPDLGGLGQSILLLPPPLVLESILQSCLATCSPYYPFITTASRTVGKRMERSRRPVLPSIFLLLMLAAGAMAVGAGETNNRMAHGLVEICRISLRRQIEQDVQLASDPEVLECALLLTIVAVWGGDKWQMDIAICQKAMFLEMHSQAGFQENREAQIARLESAEDVSQCCQVWEDQERANRITYSWFILDHEICLSQDIPSTSYLSIMNLDVPIPSVDVNSGLKSTKLWMQGMSQSSASHDAPIPPSLDEYVRYFRETNDVSSMRHVSPTSLRLLLCYLQNTAAQLRYSVDRIPSKGERHRAVGQTSLVLLSVQIQEVQELLHKWYMLARTHHKTSSTEDCSPESSTPDSDTRESSANMILYHLVMLNTMVSFPDIERMARVKPKSQIAKPGFLSWKHPYHLENTRDIYVHCGQVLRLVRRTPEPSRPSWWAGAVYRVALVAWANSMNSSTSTTGTKSQSHGEMVILDDLSPDHPSLLAYLYHQSEILPMFTGPHGAPVPLHVPVDIIYHCVHVLDSDKQTKFSMGIQQKLLNMAQRWGNKAGFWTHF